MRRVSLFLTTLVLAALLLAACGGEQPTATSRPNTNVPPATVESTSTSMATEAPTEAPTEATTVSTPGIPVTGAGAPSQAVTNMIGAPVCGLKGEQLGTVKDMVLDFNQGVVSYMIVDAKGKLVPVPYSFLGKPKTTGTGTASGTGTGSGTGTLVTDTPAAGGAGTGTLATSTPSSAATASTSTPSAGGATSATATSTTGTGTSSGTGSSGTGATSQENCFTLTVSTEQFNKVPAFEPSVMPGTGQSSADWDTAIMPYWVGGVEDIATNTPEPTSTPSSAASGATSTPSAGAATSATATATTSASSSSSGTGSSSSQGAQQMAGVILVSKLIGSSVIVSPQGAGTGSGTGTQGTIQNVIIEPRIGKLQYLVVSLGSTDTWIPVPISVLGWDATTNQMVLMVDPSLLQNAPGFPSSQMPDTATPGWDRQFSTYWQGGSTGSGNGTGSGSSTGTGGTTISTATATP